MRVEYTDRYNRFQSLRERYRTLEARNRQREEREDFLRFQIQEIDGAGFAAGEDALLAEEKKILMNAQKLADLAAAAHDALYGRERSVLEDLKAVMNAVAEIRKIDPRLACGETELGDAYYRLEDAAYTLRDYARGLSLMPAG